MKFQIIGKIDKTVMRTGRNGQYWQSIIKAAATDAYSMPPGYVVTSDYQLGQPGEEVKIEVEMVGYFVKEKGYTDAKGQQMVFWDQQGSLKVTQKMPLEAPRPAVAAAK